MFVHISKVSEPLGPEDQQGSVEEEEEPDDGVCYMAVRPPPGPAHLTQLVRTVRLRDGAREVRLPQSPPLGGHAPEETCNEHRLPRPSSADSLQLRHHLENYYQVIFIPQT